MGLIFHIKMVIVFIYYNNTPQTGWLTTGMHCLRALEGGSLKSKCWQSHILSEASRGILARLFLSSGVCQKFLVLLGLWQYNSSLRLHLHTTIFPCVSVQIYFFITILIIGLEPTLIHYDLISTLQGPYFQIRSHSQFLGFKTLIHLFGDTIHP